MEMEEVFTEIQNRFKDEMKERGIPLKQTVNMLDMVAILTGAAVVGPKEEIDQLSSSEKRKVRSIIATILALQILMLVKYAEGDEDITKLLDMMK